MIICGIDWYLTTALLLVVLLTGVIRWGWVALALFGLYRLLRGGRWSRFAVARNALGVCDRIRAAVAKDTSSGCDK